MIKKLYHTADAVKRLLFDCGMLRSIWGQESVASNGKPLPWLSMPAIHYLQYLDLRGARVFEFGSGNSTLFWQDKHANGQIRSYNAVEYNGEYHAKMSMENGFYRDTVSYGPNEERYFSQAYHAATAGTSKEEFLNPFDLTIVDGPIQWRKKELDEALRVTCSEGLIIVDDSNWLAGHVKRVCEERNLCRVDFAGFSPGVSYTKVTSLLFRNIGWLMGARLQTPAGGMHKFPGVIKPL